MGLIEMLLGEEPPIWDWFIHDDPGEYGEYATQYALENAYLPGDKKVYRNLYVPLGDGTTTEVDVLLLHEKGIVVLESKNYSGWIFGGIDQYKWCQSLGHGRKEYFYNPVKQNQKHIKALSKELGLPEAAFLSCVVFSDRCELKDVPEDTANLMILHREDMMFSLRLYFHRITIKYSMEELKKFDKILRGFESDDPKVRKEHVQKVNEKMNSDICPRCGRKLVRRNGRYGFFYGCSGFPNCRYTRNSVEE